MLPTPCVAPQDAGLQAGSLSLRSVWGLLVALSRGSFFGASSFQIISYHTVWTVPG